MNNKIKVYNDNSLVNLSNSILKHFDAETFHSSLPIIDKELKGYKKVVAILFDGMGRNIIHKHLNKDSYLRSHYVTTINSTYPPTTAAATTSFLTGKYPIETGWLGWSEYFKDYDRNIILFRNIDYNTGEQLNESISYNKFPLRYIFDILKDKGISTFDVSRYPIFPDGPKTLSSGAKKVSKLLNENENCFIYFYWDSPDREMHQYGINHRKVRKQVLKAQKFVQKLVSKTKDTAFILLADHGHVNVKYFDICDKEDIYSLLDKPLTLEKRTPSFFVKEENRDKFVSLFNKYYGDYFILLTKEEIIDIKLFGEGEPAPEVYSVFGDFVAIATGEYGMYASKELVKLDDFKGHHAGGTEEERLIDVSIFKN